MAKNLGAEDSDGEFLAEDVGGGFLAEDGADGGDLG